jgi:hypothetical protein
VITFGTTQWCRDFFFDKIATAKCWSENVKERCSFEDLRIKFEQLSGGGEEEEVQSMGIRYQ